MSGNREGAAKAKATLIEQLGEEEYYLWRRRAGQAGGIKSRGGGVTGDPERARLIGAIGGRAKRKRKEAA